MKALSQITAAVTENPEEAARCLQQHLPKAMDLKTSETLAELLSQSFDIFNTYGKDPEALRSIFKGFELALAGHKREAIMSAFHEWLKTKTTMPTPADILAILNWRPLGKSSWGEFQDTPSINDWNRLTDAQKAELSTTMKAIEKTLSGHKVRSTERGSPDFSHWERLSDEQKNECIASIPEAMKRLRIGQGAGQ